VLCTLPAGSAYAEGAVHGSIETSGSEATFHVTAPPKECTEPFGIKVCNWESWYADAYADSVGAHCDGPEKDDLLGLTEYEKSTDEASFSSNLPEYRRHIGPWDLCLYANGVGPTFGESEKLLAEAMYVYPPPTGTISLIARESHSLEVFFQITEPFSERDYPDGEESQWDWWTEFTTIPGAAACPASPGVDAQRVGAIHNNDITFGESFLFVPSVESGALTVCLYVQIAKTPEAGEWLVAAQTYTYESAAPPAPATPVTTAPPKPKPLTRAQKLAKALKACKKEPKKKRAACEKRAEKDYGPLKKAIPKKK
jgi:hypothetical protein